MTFSARLDQASPFGARLASTGLQATMSPTTSALTFNAVAGTTDPSPQVVSINNTGLGQFAGIGRGVITYDTGSGWLNATITQGYPALVTIQPTLGALTQGTYVAHVPITDANATNSPITIDVTLIVSSAPQNPIISLSQSTLTFTGTAGGAVTADQNILVTNIGGGQFAGLAVGNLVYGGGGTNWLKPPTGGTFLTGNTITGHLDPSGLTAGNYTATFDVTDASATNSPQQVQVNAAVSAVANAVLNFSTTSLNFTAVQGGSNPASQVITITNTGAGTFAGPTTSAVSYVTGSGWLTGKVVAGSANTYTLTVSLTTGALTASATAYTATFTVNDTNATNGPVTITVSFLITSTTPPGNFTRPLYDLMKGDIAARDATFNTQTNKISWNPFTSNNLTDPDATTYFGPAGTANPGVAQVRTVASYAELQSKAPLCVDGDILQITTPFTINSQWQWPKRADDATRPLGYVMVTTNGTLQRSGQNIPQGERVLESDFTGSSIPMVTVQTGNDTYAMCMAAGANGYYFYRTYFKNAQTGNPASDGMLYWGYMSSGTPLQTTTTQMPKRLKMEQNCWDSGWTDGGSVFCWRAISMNGQYARIIQNAFTNFCTPSGNDSQAIGGYNGLGAYEIWDNTLEGGAENVMFGGAPTMMGNQAYNHDIWIHQNWLHKPDAWVTALGTVPDKEGKNLIEIKNGNRVVIEDNYLQNHIGAAQQQDVVIKCQVFTSGEAAYIRTNNITVRNNYSRNGVASFEIDAGNASNFNPLNPVGRIQINNNAWVSRETVNVSGTGNSQILKNKFAGLAAGNNILSSVTIDHNFCSDTNSMIAFTPPAAICVADFNFTNNLFYANIQFQAIRNEVGLGANVTTLKNWVGGTVPAAGKWTFAKNVAVHTAGSTDLYNSADGNLATASNGGNICYTAFTGTGGLDAELAGPSTGNYNVKTTSTLFTAGTDGKPIGPDWTQLVIAQTANS